MKSLALHLIVPLVLALPLLPVLAGSSSPHSTTSASKPVTTAAASGATTTRPAPSLHAPQLEQRRHTVATTVMSAATTTAPMRRRQLGTRSSPATTTTQATFTANNSFVAESTTPSSVRQIGRLGVATEVATSSEQDVDNKLKSKSLGRRRQRRPSVSGPNPKSHPASMSGTSSPTSSRRQSKHSSLPTGDGIVASSDDPSPRPSTHNATRHHQPTPKTPRMIQRLVAGHIQNAEGRSTYQIAIVSANSTVSNSSTTFRPSAAYSHRRPVEHSSNRLSQLNGSLHTPADALFTTPRSSISQNVIADESAANADDYRDDDEALLDETGDFDNWDNGILRLSAGSGKESSPKPRTSKDTVGPKKTLSDQVRDGKYGLIEKELFRREPKRPGVLSYLPNKEIPTDNERNFGGLHEEDIWLAEDHLLVIKGGNLNEGQTNEPWPPIDDYDAPQRQIKIPVNPKIPPPFPVQLEDNGPVQFIGDHKFTIVYPIANESLPVHSAGPETNNVSSEGDGDDEKNLLTRPGPPQDVTQNGPGYDYATPLSPWLHHNQTFAHPPLNGVRPINFPILGPFSVGRNGSLDKLNGTDDFDEDDPSLYYPPAYSFVYRNNYSSPVPPGPLVPGIVLPPPANQFGRLGRPNRIYAPPTTPLTPPTHHRVPTAPPTLPPVTATTPTTEAPFGQVITRVSEYEPKTINISPSPRPVYRPHTATTPDIRRLPPHPTPPASPLQPIEPIPIPVAVPVPIYPAHTFPTNRPSIVSFVPTTPDPHTDTFSKSNPIYYEYFEAQRHPDSGNTIDDFPATTTTTTRPPHSPPPTSHKLYGPSKGPFTVQDLQRNYVQPVLPNRYYDPENLALLSPKPDIPYKTHPRPVDSFEREVEAIRDSLRSYQNQQIRDNTIPRTAKAKPLYEYNYGAPKALAPAAGRNSFQPPAEFDEEPFKPMVTYSPPIDDKNAFHALTVDKVDSAPQTQDGVEQQVSGRHKYQQTTTLIPVQPTGRTKKLRLGAKYLQQPLLQTYPQQQRYRPQYQHQHQQHLPQQLANEYQSTPRDSQFSAPRRAPWTAANKQELDEYIAQDIQPHNQHLRLPPPRNRDFPGYYYRPPADRPSSSRQNHRFYDEPFRNGPGREIINYRPQVHAPTQQRPVVPFWSLENDTYVNYAPKRPPLNPEAEFLTPYQSIPTGPYEQQAQRLPPPPVAISQQSQYYTPPPQRPPQGQYSAQQQQQQQQQQHVQQQEQQQQHQHHLQQQQQQYQLQQQYQYQQQQQQHYQQQQEQEQYQQQQQQHQQQQQQQQPVPLHRDILVNYRLPLPPINPDSEYISHPQVVRHQADPFFRPNTYRLPPPSSRPDAGESNVYYISPKYRRANNNDNNNNHNNNVSA